MLLNETRVGAEFDLFLVGGQISLPGILIGHRNVLWQVCAGLRSGHANG